MTYNEFIQNIIETRGQWGISDGEHFEVHHIIPRCMGGLPKVIKRNSRKHNNLIWLYPREHFIAHKLLAEENRDNYSLVYAYHMMSTLSKDGSRHIEITPEEYEEAKLLWLPFCKEIASNSASGTRWCTNGINSKMVRELPDGYWWGRSDTDKKSIGIASIGRRPNNGKHWYTNGVEQAMLKECPDGWWPGTLPMNDSVKEAHSKSLKGKDLPCKYKNRGYETLQVFSSRINNEEFYIDFVEYKLSDIELSNKYNTTVRMIEKYRRYKKLFKLLWKAV